MHPLDFLSDSPNVFIFRKKANKTNLGGLLFLVYLIICLVIFLYYLFDYIKNDKYKVKYTFQNHKDLNIESFNDYRINPLINISISLTDENHQALSKNFIIALKVKNSQTIYAYDSNNKQFMLRALSPYYFYIYYRCENLYNCSIRKEDKRKFYYITFGYMNYLIDHQNSSSPIYKDDMFFSYRYEFPLNHKINKQFLWHIIKYIDKTNFFSSDKEYYGGRIESGDIFIYDESPGNIYTEEENGTYYYYNFIHSIRIDADWEFYDEYTRTELPWLNIISNSFSVMMLVLRGFKFIFEVTYAKNFDNYKIIQNILTNEKPRENIIKISDKLNSNFNLSKNKKNQNNEKNIIINDKSEITKNENLLEKNINEDDDIYQTFDYSENNSFNLPKLNFCNFILNNIYCSKKCNFKKQNMISISNEILHKYFSVEKILYHQIMLENLMKDYQWKNRELKRIQNNELIIRLKNAVLIDDK